MEQNVLLSKTNIFQNIKWKKWNIQWLIISLHAENTIWPRRIIRKTAGYFFHESVRLKDAEIRNYSERIIQKLDFLLVKLEGNISGSIQWLIISLHAENTIWPRRIIRKTAGYFFHESVRLKDAEIRNYSERIIQKLDFLLVKLEGNISGSMSAKEVFDVLLTILA